jgi:hypothetical protein
VIFIVKKRIKENMNNYFTNIKRIQLIIFALSIFLATLPVPKGMTYFPSDTDPSHPHASLDGETFAPLPLLHWVRLADGSLLQRQVPYSQYRS